MEIGTGLDGIVDAVYRKMAFTTSLATNLMRCDYNTKRDLEDYEFENKNSFTQAISTSPILQLFFLLLIRYNCRSGRHRDIFMFSKMMNRNIQEKSYFPVG